MLLLDGIISMLLDSIIMVLLLFTFMHLLLSHSKRAVDDCCKFMTTKLTLLSTQYGIICKIKVIKKVKHIAYENIEQQKSYN